jgi:hypothetical protein
MRRKHISWKTKCAAALLCWMSDRGGANTWYADARDGMTEDQFLSLFHFDHNIYHEAGYEKCDEYWNLTPMLIRAHREKTKQDAKIIAKSRRIRAWNEPTPVYVEWLPSWETYAEWKFRRATLAEYDRKRKRKLQSRGFDKTRRRKMSGKVVPR